MAQELIDHAGPVRAGEELDAVRLARFLAELGFGGEVYVEQFPGGYSNLTYLIHVGDRDLVLRRPPLGSTVKSAHDMGREHRLLTALARTDVPVPLPVAYCADKAILGAPFYLMERVRGVILRARLPSGLETGPGTWTELSRAFVDRLAALHAIDYYTTPGLGDLGRPEGYAERQVHGWVKRYADARTDGLPAVERAIAWLEASIPREGEPALIHNDYKYDNLVLDPERLLVPSAGKGTPASPGAAPSVEQDPLIVAILDWEMATIGDPLLDLGTTLAYWLDPDDPEAWRRAALSDLTARPGNLSRAQLVERYASVAGREVSAVVFAYVYGLFKLAVIVQQIYARYRKGLTRDPRFANLLPVVAACGDQAARAIEKNRIDRLAS